MKISSHWKDPEARLELIPLVDVMFLSLSSFIYATLQMSIHEGIRVDLPSAAAAAADRADSVIVSVDADDHIFLGKIGISPEALESELRRRLAARPLLQVRIQGDAKARHGRMVEVLDAARRAGVREVSIEAEKPK